MMKWFYASTLRLAFGATIASIGFAFTGIGLLLNPIIAFGYVAYCNQIFKPASSRRLIYTSIAASVVFAFLFVVALSISPQADEPDAGFALFLLPIILTLGAIWGYEAEFERLKAGSRLPMYGALVGAFLILRLAYI